jgi:hypothetical protein
MKGLEVASSGLIGMSFQDSVKLLGPLIEIGAMVLHPRNQVPIAKR